MQPGTDSEPLPLLPPALMAQVQAAAREEHRPTEEILREAVERYLENRRHPDLSSLEAALATVARIRELRKGNILPEGVTIRDLINEGRA